MAKFTPRLSAPSRDDKRFIRYPFGGYSIAIAIDNQTGYTLPNCVGYAHGRLLEILGENKINWKIPACDAENWYQKAQESGFQVGSTPKLGAVACWRAGSVNNNADGVGHVAVVEEIKPNGDIVTSNSAFNGEEFFLMTVTKASGYTYSDNRPLVGFIYCGIEFEEEKPVTPTVIEAGTRIELNNIPVFSSENGATIGNRTGTYYAWETVDAATTKRIRMTNHPNRVGVKGQVSFFIETNNFVPTITATEAKSTIVKAGTKVKLDNAQVYTSENGPVVGLRTGIYYTWEEVNTETTKRVRMTNSPTRVGVPRQVSFFIDTELLK